jgi:hypothetical protein
MTILRAGLLAMVACSGCMMMAGGDSSMLDGGPPDDLTAPPGSDLTADSIFARWRLVDMDDMQVNCDDPRAGVKNIQFTVTDPNTKTAVTMAPCPAGNFTGDVYLMLPANATVGELYTVSTITVEHGFVASDITGIDATQSIAPSIVVTKD